MTMTTQNGAEQNHDQAEPRTIYMDHAATTPVDPRVVEAMLPYWSEHYGNPSSVYRLSEPSREALHWARSTVADILGARPNEIVFTSCGTESNNLAIRGTAHASRHRGNHIITIPIEHHAVDNTCAQLEDEFGYRVTRLPVDRHGVVDPDDVGRAITPETTLISIMYANNEVGTIEPLAEIGRIARARGVPLHTDAVQAGGSLPLNVDDLMVDMLSLSGHKFYAPKGVGMLYIRAGHRVLPTQTGGGQERHLRAGTENVAYIVGLAKALRLAYDEAESETRRLTALRDRLVQGLLAGIPDAHLTGHPEQRLANSASFYFAGVDGESILLHLDLAGVAASTGSACASGDEGPSHVLSAMGIEPALARGSLRLSLGRKTTEGDIDYVLGVLPDIIRRLRAMSPMYAEVSAR
jgi:cysteine desulfurase